MLVSANPQRIAAASGMIRLKSESEELKKML